MGSVNYRFELDLDLVKDREHGHWVHGRDEGAEEEGLEQPQLRGVEVGLEEPGLAQAPERESWRRDL